MTLSKAMAQGSNMFVNSYKSLLLFVILLSLLSPTFALAEARDDIDFILNAKKPPKGVVFEVVEGKESKLELALIEINGYIKELNSKHPALKIAVVSHGTEQFALLNENKKQFSNTHTKVQSLVSNDVPVHVCGTHASWYHFEEKDFPAYVEVSDTGPGQIRDYQRLGYALIEIDIK